MIDDPKDKISSYKINKITEGNNPNDDEEILKNSNKNSNIESEKLDRTDFKDSKHPPDAETIGIP